MIKFIEPTRSNNALLPYTPQNCHPVQLQQLVDEWKVVRILQPALIERVTTAVYRHGAHPYVLQFNGQFYLDLHTIPYDKQRKQIYYLLRKLQLGEEIDMSLLPIWLQQILEPRPASRSQLAGSATVGMAVGLLSGVMAIAVGVLLMAVTGADQMNEQGLPNSAVVFIIATIIGWLTTTAVLWRQMRPASSEK